MRSTFARCPLVCTQTDHREAPCVHHRLLTVAFAHRHSRKTRRNSSPSRSGRSRCRRTGSSARSPASRSTATTTSGSCIARRRCSTTRRARRRTRRRPSAARPRRAVMKFDADGNLLASWGGAGQATTGSRTSTASTSTATAMSGSAATTTATRSCSSRPTANSSSRSARTTAPRARTRTTRLGRPAHMMTDDAANEIYVADGYGNRRVIVFDSKTGAYKRHWGAYGTKTPNDDKLPAYDPDGAALAELRQSGALRAAVERRAGLCLRPRQQPHPGVPQGRHVREGVPRRAADLAERLGVGPGAVGGPAAALHLHGRRRQRPDRARCRARTARC